MIMRVMHSWRDSLALLAPSSLKPLALVTLKSVVDTYKVLFRVWYLWLVPVLALILQQTIFIEIVMPAMMPIENQRYFLITTTAWASLLFFFQLWYTCVIVLAVRASVKQKSAGYFIGYIRHFLILYMFAFIVVLLGTLMSMLSLVFVPALLTQPSFPIGALFLLFFFDSNGSIKALWINFIRACKMVIYNLPLAVLFFSLLFGLYIILGYVYIALFILSVVSFCIWNTIYIKRLHDQPDIYFNQPK